MSTVELQQLLERRAAALRRSVVSVAPDDLVEVLVLCAGEDRVAFVLQDVEAVVAEVKVTPLPNLGPPWSGIVHLRGRMVAVADLGQLLGRPAAAVSHVVVLAGDTSCALGVAGPPSATRVRLGRLATADEGTALGSAVRGVTDDGIVLVDATALLETLR